MTETRESMAGTTILLTGGTSGIGRAAAVQLGERGATVLVTGRDGERGGETVREIERAGGEGAFLAADFADFDQVRELAARVRDRTDALDVLCHNAGVWMGERELTAGVEYTFAVNHLAPYLLTHELVDQLAPDARVVTVSSELHRRGRINFADLTLGDGYSGVTAYAQSKLANVLFARELARRLPEGQTANAVHPGVIPGSRLTRHSSTISRLLFGSLRLVPGLTTTEEGGADPLVHLAASPAVAGTTGAYFDRKREATPSQAARDDETARKLWQVSAELVGVEAD
ncbi:SDR family oxidoreductase [Natronomonas sp. EA1]|uniref:SDR family oxidoreductase n=1 Tax=Natronomonas sp. EA1 TaxID=3421655 RepID=UPI003EBD7D6A